MVSGLTNTNTKRIDYTRDSRSVQVLTHTHGDWRVPLHPIVTRCYTAVVLAVLLGPKMVLRP